MLGYGSPGDDSARNAPNSTRRAGVAGRYRVNNVDRTITTAYCARLTATFSRFLFSRNDMPRGTSSMEEAVIEMKTSGCFGTLEFVDRSGPHRVESCDGQLLTQQCDLSVVGRQHQNVGGLQRSGAVLVGPLRAE